MSLTVEEIIENGERWNQELLDQRKDEELYMTWDIVHQKSSVFASTSCLVTAASIRWKSNLGQDWTLVDDITFEQVQKMSPYFQITIGEEWMEWQHILTIWDNSVIQSYFKQYKIKSFESTPRFIEALKNINDPENYKTVTGVELDTHNLQIFYWIPESKI